ncbi:MAG: YicC family protein [Gammaproteobacteria bacterium]|nr:YicC family protein [Gammaproteobacteria bacterium]MBU1558366.1 YicC family protein [Gammaproteobacteria bacterium]MBU1926477.1 YicC family protein [Gammaproteobacteria bacterium]MBU2546418.1 YicC family protein [Gammaproteobacteria bacterium]
MIRSMTAFASKQLQHPLGSVTWEIRSVNNRYLDLGFRLPEFFRPLEIELRHLVKRHVQRGKVDCFLSFNASKKKKNVLALDFDVVDQLQKASSEIQKRFKRVTKVNPMELLSWPGVIKMELKDLSEVCPEVLTLFEETLIELNEAKAREGSALVTVILEKLDLLVEQVEKVKTVLPNIIKEQRASITERLQELKQEVDQGRLEQEMVYFAQRADIAEEVDRLISHAVETRRILKGKGVVGRRLDFLMQEMNREANTLGSKATDLVLTNASVELKVLIEQMREQVQNIE